MSEPWTVFAVKYADRSDRTRADSFIFDPRHDAGHPIDYFVWVLRRGEETILVDTAYDAAEAARRGRPVRRGLAEALAPLGLGPEGVGTVIVTHLHYDHAGGLTLFPDARFHLQAAEMAYATGPCMCHDVLRMPFTAEHVCDMVRHVFSGRVVFHHGDGEVAPGVTVHRIGGHSRGLQAVRVLTEAGWLCLASDASHYYENFLSRSPFPIVVDLEDMLAGFDTIERLASERRLVVPGHDPLVARSFPAFTDCGFIWRLDRGPSRPIPGLA